MKHVITILVTLICVSCSNSAKNADNNSSSTDTTKQVSDSKPPADYPDNAVYVGQKIEDFISSAKKLYEVKKEKITLEGDSSDIYNVYEKGQKLLAVEPDINKPDMAWRIWVCDAQLKTEQGIGVGSTLADIKAKYQIENIGTEEGITVQIKDNAVTFLMGSSSLPQDWWRDMNIEKLPQSLPVDGIIISDPESYLTLDKKIKAK